MASLVTIGNLALSHLGDDANLSSLTEQTPQAAHVSLFLPIARDEMLESYPFRFARRRARLALRDESNGAWAYSYALPSDCLKLLAVMPESYTSDDQSFPYSVESADDGSSLVYTNIGNAIGIYVKRVEDPAAWSPLFVSALSRLLAAYVAGPLLKGDTGSAAGIKQYQAFQVLWQRAVISDARQTRRRQAPDSAPWIRARGVSTGVDDYGVFAGGGGAINDGFVPDFSGMFEGMVT